MMELYNSLCFIQFEVSSSASNSATTATRDNILKYAKSKNDGLQDILRKQFDT